MVALKLTVPLLASCVAVFQFFATGSYCWSTLLDTTPLDLLHTVRLEHAALLLRTESDTIGSIANRTGFKWAPTFTARFTSHFGVTPSAYRGLHWAALHPLPVGN